VAIEQQPANDAHGAPGAAMPISSKGASRRRFAQTAAGVGGVLMTLQSQAACVGVAVSTSGYQSYVNSGCVMNSHITKTTGGRGNTPAYWAGCSSWPKAPTGTGACSAYSFITLFQPTKASLYKKPVDTVTTTTADGWYKDKYGRTVWGPITTSKTTTTYEAMSLMEVLNANVGDNDLGKLCVAAYLNAASNAVTYLPVNTVQQIFTGCDSGAGYAPPTNTTTKWSRDTCITYLKGTMA
jgi:hypothetical protein